MSTGLVIGKFYPPHRGHSYLIETALSEVDHLDVVVCDHPSQTIPGPVRAAWLRELHPEAVVRLIEDFGDDDNSERWANYTTRVLGSAPDVVFTSEPYGPHYAELMGSLHVMVDADRSMVPVSGAAVRQDPASWWAFLDPPVRAWFTKRIVIVGAESTGTTILTEALASHFDTVSVPEYGRTYSEAKLAAGTFEEDAWSSEDFIKIATRQQEMEDEAARRSKPLLFCDTDALATAIWHERYMGSRSVEVQRIAASRNYYLYVLTGDEIPFVQDGLRDGEHMRGWMTSRFREELARRGSPWVEVHGTHDQRMQTVIAALEDLRFGRWEEMHGARIG